MIDPAAFFAAELAEHAEVLAQTRRALGPEFARMLEVWVQAIESGNKLVFFGNGGSAGDAQHLAAELTVRYKRDRAPIAALALTTDGSALTAIGNDLGFDRLFARQIAALGRPGDVAVAISTSGKSRNVIAGLAAARDIGMIATGLGAGAGGDMPGFADPLLLIPSATTARIQEMHITLGHMLCGALELRLGLVEGE